MSSLVRNYTERKDQAQELLLQGRLQVLLRRLGWCYAALWTFNPQTRLLEWKRGHFQMDTSSGPPVWNRQQLCTAYKSCSFAPGAGYVGRVYLEGRQMWLRGESVCQSAGSLQQSQFLRDAHIQTVMCIPWLSSILELGTTNLVREEVELMDRIQEVMSHDLLSVLPDDIDAAAAAGLSGFDHIPNSNASNSSPQQLLLFNQVSSTSSRPPKPSAAAAMTTTTTTTSSSLPDDHGAAVSRSSFQSAFENLSDQVWRSDIFMQSEQGHNNIAAATTSSGSNGSSQEVNINFNSRKMNSTNTSNFDFSCKTSPVRTAADQLHQQFNLHGTPISDSSKPDRTSSSGKLLESAYGGRPGESSAAGSTRTSTPFHHHQHHQSSSTDQSSLRRSTSCSDQYEIQKAISLLETTQSDVDAVEDHWRLQLQVDQSHNLNNNNNNNNAGPASTSKPQQLQPAVDLAGFSFPSWPHQQQQQQQNDVDQVPAVTTTVRSSADCNLINLKQESAGPALNLRRRHTFSAMEVLKEVDAYHQQQEAATSAPNVEAYDDFNYFDPPAPMESNLMARCRGRARMMPGSCSGSGTGSVLHTSHSEAAVSHVLAERQRRCKQKDNFATLRRLVPIISKGDKTSTLIDAIAYLKDLQNTIVHLEENKEDMDRRVERLSNKCMELEEQNKHLVAVLSGGKLGNTFLLNQQK